MELTEAMEELHLGSYDEAADLFRDAAESGNPDACDFMVQMHLAGLSGRISREDALHYAIRGYELRSRDSCFHLGSMYRSGFLGEPDPAKAWEFLLEGAEKFGDLRCQHELGEMLRLGETGGGPRVDEAVRHYSTAAAGGYYPSQFRLARIFERRVPDFGVTLEFYRNSAEKGHADAMLRLGEIYQKGIRVEKDPAQSMSWYRKAAEAGSREAFFHVARWRLLTEEGAGSGDDAGPLRERLEKECKGKDAGEALYLLACLELAGGNTGAARDLFRRSLEAGCLPGMVRYAALLAGEGGSTGEDGLIGEGDSAQTGKREQAGNGSQIGDGDRKDGEQDEAQDQEQDPVRAFALLHAARIAALSGAPWFRAHSELMSQETLVRRCESLIADLLPELSEEQRLRGERLADETAGRMFGIREQGAPRSEQERPGQAPGKGADPARDQGPA